MNGRRQHNFDYPGPGPGPDHEPGPGPFGHGGPPPGRGPGRSRGRGPGRHRGGRPPGGRRRNRVSRGEVRSAILALLADQPMHGYQVMQELEDRSGGGWQASPGSIYPTLQLLADEGLVISEARDGKNVFSLTDAGTEAAEAIDEPPAWERFAAEGPGGALNLRRAMAQVGAAVKQVAATGSDGQMEAANTILSETRKALYRLLADDE